MKTTIKLATILFIQLSCSSLLDSTAIKNALKIATQRVNVRAPPFSIVSPVRCGLFPSEHIPRHIPEVPSNVLQVPGHEGPCEFHANRDEIGATRIGSKSHAGVSASRIGITPFVWGKRDDVAQPSRAYLPPVRGGHPRAPHDHLGVLPIEVEDAKLSSPRYSSDLIATRPDVDRAVTRIRVEKAKSHHLLIGENQGRKKSVSTGENIRPVYEKIDEDDRMSSNRGDRQENRKSNGDPTEASSSTNLSSDADPQMTKLRRESTRDSSTAFSTLDWFLNKGGYNSQLHPPTNPLLALVLSHYGRYLPGAERPKVYSYMAVNNIHNNRPFGQYKLECDEASDYYAINNPPP